MDSLLTPSLVPLRSWLPSVECLPKISANALKSVALATACGEWNRARNQCSELWYRGMEAWTTGMALGHVGCCYCASSCFSSLTQGLLYPRLSLNLNLLCSLG